MNLLPVTALRSNGADYLRTYHHVTVDDSVTLDMLLEPKFWAHHHLTLKPGDLLDVISPVIDVQLRVVERGVGYVKMRPRVVWQDKDAVRAIVEPGTMPDLPDGYEVKRGPGGRWRVFTKDPQFELKAGLATEAEARKVAIEHASKAAA